MKTIRGLEIAAEGTGISQPLSENVNLLGGLLGQVLAQQAGPDLLDLVERLRLLCKQAAVENREELRQEAADQLQRLDARTLRWLLQAFGAFFHLVNQAEKQEILRVNRERSRQQTRPESIADAVGRLKRAGFTLEQVLAALRRLDIQPTLTAHPTEARRRSILHKQRRIADLLSRLRRPDATDEEINAAADALHEQIALLIATGDVRLERPDVIDEVEHGLYFMRGPIWEVAPRIQRDVQHAVHKHYGTVVDAPVFLRWRSWIGGDRDGNPNVTAELTGATLARHRQTALELHRAELIALREELSLSDDLVPTPPPLEAALAGLNDGWVNRNEPYRRLITWILEQLDVPTPYGAADLLAHLELMRGGLEASGFADVARTGRLARLIVRVRTFGLSLSALDIRQHSRVHEAAVAALLAAAGVEGDYAQLDEPGRVALLERLLRNRTPLSFSDDDVPDEARELLATFALIRSARQRDPDSIGSYIISMTHSVSDVLEPMLLAKQTDLLRVTDDGFASDLDYVPLFETIEDLSAAGHRLTELLGNECYRLQLAARGNFQEIMLGYSDSNKDGGYWMANWAQQRAQESVSAACRAHDIDFRLFHGRGGSVGRGGGHTGSAIHAMPRSAHNGRIRVTEQGEVISFRYGLAGLAHRHLEQLVSAMLLTTARSLYQPRAAQHDASEMRLIDDIATASMRAYRELIDNEQLWRFYIRATPIEHISHIPIASRPVSRKAAAEVDFEDLRAIPWVFAWTQTRYNVPGWYGVGAGLAGVASNPAVLDPLRRMYREWPFLTAVVDNAQREMARARLEIARRYADLAGSEGAACDAVIARDFALARDALLAITQQSELLDNNQVLQKSIALRNPYTDVLNLLQIELLRRHRTTSAAEERAELRQLLFLSINGIAAAMQSTG